MRSYLPLFIIPLMLFAACQEVEVEPVVSDSLPDVEYIYASIPDSFIAPASSGDASTKMVAVEEGSGLDWNWSSGDQISVVAGNQKSLFTICPGFSDKNACFEGRHVDADKFSIIFPGKYSSESDLKTISLKGQTQIGNGSCDHLFYYALMSNVDDYSSFEFSPAWATAHGGSMKQNGALRFKLTLPSTTTAVNSIVFSADAELFHESNEDNELTSTLSINLEDVSLDSEKTVTAFLTTSWFDDVMPAGTQLTITVRGPETIWYFETVLSTEKILKAGFLNTITLPDAGVWEEIRRYEGGSGTETDPWQIKNASQLMNVRDDLVSGESRYFKLVADINLAGIEWTPLNNVEPYDKYIHFDGDGHIISNLTVSNPETVYPSFAGVLLYGTVENVTFNNPVIAAGANKAGVVASYVGTTDNIGPAAITDVLILNPTVSSTNTVGAFVGQVTIANATVTNCHVQGGTVTGSNQAGGFAGYVQNGFFIGCSSSATVSGTRYVGGFVGRTVYASFTDCRYEDGTISIAAGDNTTSSQRFGGFVGYAAKDNDRGARFTGCYVKGATLDVPTGQRAGGFVGQADNGNVFFQCSVQNVVMDAGLNSGGFVGVDYADVSEAIPDGGIYQCYVEGGSVKGNRVGGFVGWMEKAVIQNCYSTMDVDSEGGSEIGGFIGRCMKSVTVQHCYSTGAVTNGGNNYVGAFVGYVNGDATTHINSCIAWNNVLGFAGNVNDDCDVTGNYCGTEGTLGSQMSALGFDAGVWNLETGKLLP